MYFLRKLREFRVDTNILELFYKPVIESVTISCIIVWFKSLSYSEKIFLGRIRRQAEGIIGINLHTFEDLYESRLLNKVKSIVNDVNSPFV